MMMLDNQTSRFCMCQQQPPWHMPPSLFISSIVQHKLLCCRCAIPLKRFSKKPEQEIEDWYELGKNDFATDSGTVGAFCNAGALPLVATAAALHQP